MQAYPAGSNAVAIRNLVPVHSTHVIDGGVSTMHETGLIGQVDSQGARLKIKYFGEMKQLGDAEVIYTFLRSSGIVIARTRALRTVAWDDFFPERTGKYEISGTCAMK